ncbi:MAG: RNA polymerase sigma-70 factor [Bacteroidetes bacterium]|nr:RNA polymerase sigma-70 factor [Bacteroidota bacterium]
MDKEVQDRFNHIDKSTFEMLFNNYFPALTSFARKFVHDMDTAKDIVHNVFINFWEKRENVDPNKSVKSYLFSSVHNRCLNHIRDQKKFDQNDPDIVIMDNPSFDDPSSQMEETELELKIKLALQELPEKCREVFLMNRYDGLKYREIADKLNISIKTVETQMSKGLKLMKEKLRQYINLIILALISWF